MNRKSESSQPKSNLLLVVLCQIKATKRLLLQKVRNLEAALNSNGEQPEDDLTADFDDQAWARSWGVRHDR